MKLNIIALILCAFIVHVNGQLTPQKAIKNMGRGVNMGNTLDPPNGEGAWGNPPVVESNFDDYKNAGRSARGCRMGRWVA